MQKRRLIEEITPYFLEHGYRTFTLDDFSKQFKISKKTIYELFSGKQDIINEVLRYRNEKLKGIFYEIRDKSTNAIDEIIAFYNTLYSYSSMKNQQRNIHELRYYYKNVYDNNIQTLYDSLKNKIILNYERGLKEDVYSDCYDGKSLGYLFGSFYITNNLDENRINSEIALQQNIYNFTRQFLYGILSEKGLNYMENKDDCSFPFAEMHGVEDCD